MVSTPIESLELQLVSDFGDDIAGKILDELKRFEGKCFYDTLIKKVVYYDLNDAFRIYMKMQIEEAEKHRWIESEKAQRDLGEDAEIDWVVRYGKDFRDYWRKTHNFIPPKPL
jgi:hypothetical protein